jgi:hypothetical protein
MQSPISKLREINPDLDDDENMYLEAFQEYRAMDFIVDFKNYKNYYEDAKKSNERNIV